MLLLESLQTHLRGALEILREHGKLSGGRALLFTWFWLKCLNDDFQDRRQAIWHEEIAAGRSEAEARALLEDPDEYRFFLPPEAQWSYLTGAAGQFSARLAQGCTALEQRYPNSLAGIFRPVQLGMAASTSTPEEMEDLGVRLAQHFEKLDLSRRHLYSPEIAGLASTQLLAELAASHNRKESDFASPPALMQLLAALLQPQPGMRICDPACGTGGSLVACAQFLEQHGHHPQNLSLYGQEIDSTAWALCKFNLFLHDLPDHQIWLGDALASPLAVQEDRLQEFDLVLSHLPFSVPAWEHAAAAHDPYRRFTTGIPPAKRGEWAFVLQAWAMLRPGGRAAVVVPQGILFRGGAEAQIRRALLQKDVEAIATVISLPAGWLYDPKLPAAIIVLDRAKPAHRQEQVLFIDANALTQSLSSHASNAALALVLAALHHLHGGIEALVEDLADELERRQAAAESRNLRLQEIWRHDKQGQTGAEEERRKSLDELEHLRLALQPVLEHPDTLAHCYALVGREVITGNDKAYLTATHYCAEAHVGSALNLAQELASLRTLIQERERAETDMDRLLLEFDARGARSGLPL